MMTPYETREIERKLEEVNQEIKVLQRLLNKAETRRDNLETDLIVTRKRIKQSGIKY